MCIYEKQSMSRESTQPQSIPPMNATRIPVLANSCNKITVTTDVKEDLTDRTSHSE